MNYYKLNQDIVIAYALRDITKIRDIHINLINERSKLDRWFNKYLDMFDEVMNNRERSDPIWKLYHAKHAEYSDIVQTIKTAEYYLKKA